MDSFKAVIFDLDGTLLNTIEDITDSMNASLREQGLEPYTVEDYKYFVGDGVDNLVKKLMKNRLGDDKVHALVRAGYMAEYAQRQHDKTKPYPGIMALLKRLNEQSVLVNVLSNKPDPDTQTVIKYYFPQIRFANVCGKKPGYEVKPDPRSVLEMIDQMHLSKAEVLYVGDTYTDMMTAKNAGLTSVGVLWGFRKVDELMQGDAHYIIKHPKEILAILKEGIPHAA